MPDRNERENDEVIDNRAGASPHPRHRTTSEWDVKVPQTPLIEAAMPAAPELHDAVVVAHAAHHVFRRVDAVQQRPEAEEAPWNEQFEPDVLEVEEPEHTELRGRVLCPVGLGVEDGDHVRVVDHNFHGEKDHDEAD